MEVTDEYLDDRDQQIKLQGCVENLVEKECMYTGVFSHALSFQAVADRENKIVKRLC